MGSRRIRFMMPIGSRRVGIEHYTSPRTLSRHFSDQWRVPFLAAHVPN